MQLSNHPVKILCVRLDNMGDVLLTSPAFRALHEKFPKAKLTLLTSKSGAAISSYIPFIDNTIVFSAPWVKNAKTSESVVQMAKNLEKEKFDISVVFTNFSQNPLPAAMLCYLAKIPIRIGYCRENPYELFTHWVPDKEPFTHISHGVKRQLDLVKLIGAETSNESLSLQVDPYDQAAIDVLLEEKNIDKNKPFILIHPGASEEKRRYSISFFCDVAKKIIWKYGFQVGITGKKEENALLVYLNKECRGKTYLFSDLTVGQLIALVEKSDVLLSNNTGPVHIASAVNTPVVVLYAQTNPEHTPWKVANKVFYFPVKNHLRSKNQLLQNVSYKFPQSFSVNRVIQSMIRLLSIKNGYTDNEMMQYQNV